MTEWILLVCTANNCLFGSCSGFTLINLNIIFVQKSNCTF